MSTLHLVRQSAFSTDDFAQCLQVALKGDNITFIDDGCYNLTHPLIKKVDNQINLYVMKEHANARALPISSTLISSIDMRQLVSLTFQAKSILTWQ